MDGIRKAKTQEKAAAAARSAEKAAKAKAAKAEILREAKAVIDNADLDRPSKKKKLLKRHYEQLLIDAGREEDMYDINRETQMRKIKGVDALKALFWAAHG